MRSFGITIGNIALLLLSAAMRMAAAADPVPVAVQRLGDVLVEREIRAPAGVVSVNRAILTSQITALVAEIGADVGKDVARGDLLIRLDAADARLALARAEAELASLDAQAAEAAQRLRRAEELLARDFISDDELDNRRTAVTVLEANRERQRVAIDEAKLALARTEIRAPFAAEVVARQAQIGSLATPGSPLMTLSQTTDREIDAEIDPRDTASLRSGSRLRYESQGREWPVTLSRLSGVIEPDTRKQRGRFVFAGEPAPIGSSGHIVWTDAAGLVPVALIVQRDERFGVFTADGGRARFVPIPAAQEGRPAPVDLPRDALIVTRGQARLQDGDPLEVTRQ